MNTFTLTTDDFKKIHNAKCEVHYIKSVLDEVVHPKLVERLNKLHDLLSAGLGSIYEQERLYSDKCRRHYDEVARKLNLTSSTWSMYEVDNLYKLSPYRASKMVYEGGNERVEVDLRPDSPLTWIDLWVAANHLIRESEDGHHIFIEGFRQKNDVLFLHTGS